MKITYSGWTESGVLDYETITFINSRTAIRRFSYIASRSLVKRSGDNLTSCLDLTFALNVASSPKGPSLARVVLLEGMNWTLTFQLIISTQKLIDFLTE